MRRIDSIITTPPRVREAARLQRQQGFTLVEVLIAVVVLSLGMLGLVGLQMTATRSNQSAYHRTQAALLAQDALERIRINADEAKIAGYDIAFADAPPAAPNCIDDSQDCNPTALRNFDLAEWLGRLSAELPSGDGQIAVTEDTSVSPTAYSATVSVRWFEPMENTTLQYDLDSRL